MNKLIFGSLAAIGGIVGYDMWNKRPRIGDTLFIPVNMLTVAQNDPTVQAIARSSANATVPMSVSSIQGGTVNGMISAQGILPVAVSVPSSANVKGIKLQGLRNGKPFRFNAL